MQQLATIIRGQLDALVDQYDARLRTMPGYSSLPEAMRRDMERHFLNLIVQSLDTGDYSRLVQHAQERASQWAAQGLNLGWFQQALIVPEELLVPLVKSVETSNFVWQALNRSQNVVWQMIAERARQADAALAQERSLLHTLIDSLPDQIFVKDTEGRVVLNNMADARAMGVASPAEATGKNVFDLYPVELAELYHADDLAVIQTGQPLYNREEPGIDAAGQTRWILTTKVPLTDAEGKPIGLVGIARDVTARKQIELTLQESEERFRRLSEATTEGLTFHDKGLILDANPAIVTLFGFTTAAELVGRNLLEFIVPDSRALVLQKMQLDDVHPYEVHCIRKDGSIFPVETSTRVYQYGERTIRATAVRDITERKQLEQQIQGSLELREYQVQTGTEVAQEIAAAPDLSELFERVVTLIKERFSYYHAQIFRYDPALDAIVLVTGYGEVGQHMLAEGHRLSMGHGVVGTAAANGKTILATDVTQDQDWRPNPYLPDTRGELAVPIKLRDEVLGILDVQSDRAGALSTDDRLLLEGLCGQIAIAMESTRLLKSVQQSEQLMRTVINSTSDWIFIKDQEHRYRLVNQGYANSLHLPIEEFIGKNDLELGFPEELVKGNAEKGIAGFWADDRQVMDGGETKVIPNDLVMIDGVLRTYNTIKTPLRDAAGQVWGVLAFGRDITERKQAEEAVRRSEAELFEALKIAKLAYWEYDVEKDLFLFNDQFYSIFHTTAEQEGGYQLSSAQYAGKFVYPEDLPVVGSEIERALSSTDRHYSRDLVHRIQYADGGVGYMSVSINIDRDEQGHILRYYGANQDITATKQAEEEMQRTQRFLDSIVENIPIMLFVKSAHDLRFVRWNKAGEELAGFPRADMIGKNDLDFFPPEEAEHFMANDRQVLESRQPIDIPEEPLQTLYKGIRTLHTRKIPILDEQGNPQYLLGISEDITERKQAEAVLAQERNLMRTLIDTMPDSIYAKDTESRFTLANLTEIRINGATSFDELRGKNDFDRYPRELAEHYFAVEQPVLRDGVAVINHEERGLDDAGNLRWHLSTKVPLRDSQGRIVGLVGMTRDITESKQVEAERERLLLEQQKRALQLQTAAEVSRAASSILNTEQLLPQVADLMRDRFNFYYVGIFLTDESGSWAILRAGTGEAGQRMLADGHKLTIGGHSMISQCITTQQARIALDVGEEAIRFDNPLLPLTRSEVALPLISRNHIIGAVTIQSEQPAAFTSEDVAVLQSMADQVGTAVENARLYEQTQAALGDTDRLLQASAELNVSQTYADVLEVVRKYTVLGQNAQTVAINVFDLPWTASQTPAWIELIGYFSKRAATMDVGTRFPIALFPSAQSLLRPDAPSVIEDFDTAQADPNTYALFTQRLASKSVIFLPLVVGGQWFGYMNVLYPNPTRFAEADVRRLMAMVGQAAVAVQSLRNLASAQQTLSETDASYRATQAIGRAQSVEAILEATTHVVDLIGMTRATLRVVSRRDVTNAITATDVYAYHRIDQQWILQPIIKDAPVSDFDTLRPLQRNPEAVTIYADAQDPNSHMPEEVRQALLADTLRGAIATSVSLQNEVLGFLSFSGPQVLNETAEQRLRLTIRALSDQAAVALQNRLLFEQTRAALQEVDTINRRLTGEAWNTYLHQQSGQDVVWATDDDLTAPASLAQLDDQLVAGEVTFEPDPEDHTEATVTAPILLRGQPIGALRMRTASDTWNKDTEAVLTDIAGHIAQAVENARLIEQTQRTAARERAINEINARVRQTIDLDAILRTAVNELGQSLKAARVTARINVADTPQPGTAGSPRGNDHE